MGGSVGTVCSDCRQPDHGRDRNYSESYSKYPHYTIKETLLCVQSEIISTFTLLLSPRIANNSCNVEN
jgi:hypothetical protein